jgi:hypothetical protein
MFPPVPGQEKTGEPLSPAPTPALTRLWQSWVMLDPETFTAAQVALICPKVQPVVRPILFACAPATGFARSAVMVRNGLAVLMVSGPDSAPREVVRAIRARLKLTP